MALISLFNEAIPFIKMHGIGNDYIYFDFTEFSFDKSIINPSSLQELCNRRYGIGSDGLVVISKSDKADIKMNMWNADGSYSKMCGNALRCIGYYWYKKTSKKEFFIESETGVHLTKIIDDKDIVGIVKVQMGKPIFEKEKIPYKGNIKSNLLYEFYDASILPYKGFVVSMGNPHCIFIMDDVENIEIEKIGPKIENHSLFPERTNVEFIKILQDGSIYQRTWERGSGETLACGSGACAVHIVGVLEKNLPKKNIIHLKGGDLEIEWNEEIWMTGSTSIIYKGFLTKQIYQKIFNF
jgi:diaminopimelate epimerase